MQFSSVAVPQRMAVQGGILQDFVAELARTFLLSMVTGLSRMGGWGLSLPATLACSGCFIPTCCCCLANLDWFCRAGAIKTNSERKTSDL